MKGAFSVLGNTLVTYDERFDKNREFCLSTFNAVAYKMRPCIQVNTDRRRVKVCVKQSVCAPWPIGCKDITELCQEVTY